MFDNISIIPGFYLLSRDSYLKNTMSKKQINNTANNDTNSGAIGIVTNNMALYVYKCACGRQYLERADFERFKSFKPTTISYLIKSGECTSCYYKNKKKLTH